MPQVTQSSLSEIKVKLQVENVDKRGVLTGASQEDLEIGNTARLNGSGRSSTLSIGRRRDGKSDDDNFLGLNNDSVPPNNTAIYNVNRV